MAGKAEKRKAGSGNVLAVDPAGQPGGKRQAMMRLVASSTVDRWLFEGGPGFEAPEAAAIAHVRALWNNVGSGSRVTGDFDRPVGTRPREGALETSRESLMVLAEYERQFPPHVWEAFEKVVRWDQPAGAAGARMARAPAEARAHAKACVGFVASKIAEWRGD